MKAAATELGLAVTDQMADLVEAGVDLGVVVAYGRIIPAEVLAAVPMVNLHFSLLPRWRGAAPVERAILAGDPSTGVDLMVVEEGLDTGGIFARTEIAIGPDDQLEELRARLVAEGARLLVEHLGAGLGEPRPQVGEPSYAAKVDASERELDWSRPAVDVHRRVRVGDAWTTFHGKRLKVHRTAVPPSATVPRSLRAMGPWSSWSCNRRGSRPWTPWRGHGARAGSPGERLPS